MSTQVNSQAEALLVLNEMDLLHLKAEDEVWHRLKDNRDMSTMVSWDPKEMEVPQTAVKESFNLEVMFARCRHLLLRLISDQSHPEPKVNMANFRCISSAVLVAEDPGNAPLLPSLEAQISSLSLHLDTCRSNFNLKLYHAKLNNTLSQGSLFQCRSKQAAKTTGVNISKLFHYLTIVHPLQAPDTPRFLPYTQSAQLEVLTPLLQLIQCLIKPTPSTANCQTILTPLPSLLSRLDENLPVEECGTNLRARGGLMELLVFRVETLGLVAVLLAAVAQIFGVGASKAGKKVGFLNNRF